MCIGSDEHLFTRFRILSNVACKTCVNFFDLPYLPSVNLRNLSLVWPSSKFV